MDQSIIEKGRIEIWEVARLIPYDKNAKKHSDEQVEKLAKLIEKMGWTQPIVVQRSSCSIIAGHGRRLAAIFLGLKKVPVVVLDVSDAEARALRLADNRVASTDYDAALIKTEILDLSDLKFDIDLLGFDKGEIAFLDDAVMAIDESVFVDDISGAVEDQKAENAARQAEIDKTNAPLAKSFGFKNLSVEQSRRVKRFMTKIEAKAGVSGADALMIYFDEIGV